MKIINSSAALMKVGVLDGNIDGATALLLLESDFCRALYLVINKYSNL